MAGWALGCWPYLPFWGFCSSTAEIAELAQAQPKGHNSEREAGNVRGINAHEVLTGGFRLPFRDDSVGGNVLGLLQIGGARDHDSR